MCVKRVSIKGHKTKLFWPKFLLYHFHRNIPILISKDFVGSDRAQMILAATYRTISELHTRQMNVSVYCNVAQTGLYFELYYIAMFCRKLRANVGLQN